jgi:hypothetical protein
LVIASEQLAPQLSTGESTTGVTAVVPPLVPCPDAPPAAATSYRDFYFGQILTVRSITLSARSIDVMKHPSLVSSLRVTLLDGSNRPLAVRSAITPTADGWSIALARPAAAGGFRITGPIHQVMQTSSVVDASGAAYWLAGPMQEAVDGSRWRLVETRGTLQVFRTTQGLKPHAWIQGGRAQGSVISTIEQPNGGEVEVVRMKHAGVLVRSEAWLPGWEASVVPVGGGRALGSTVVPADLVQSLHLGAGSFKVTFSYHAPHLLKALILSAVSLVALVVAGVVVRRRRSLAGSGAGRVRP